MMMSTGIESKEEKVMRNKDYTIKDIKIVETQGTTVCLIVTSLHGEEKIFTGVAKLHPTDKFNRSTGELIAYARAFEKYSASLMRQANGIIAHLDNVAANKVKPTKNPVKRIIRTFQAERSS